MPATVRHSGHNFKDLAGDSHEITFAGIKGKPVFTSESDGTGPKGEVCYELNDGTTCRFKVSAAEAIAIAQSYERWVEQRQQPIRSAGFGDSPV
ncbi:MAG: hypothetical protein RJQ07_07990 [Pseudomonadales bacterium]